SDRGFHEIAFGKLQDGAGEYVTHRRRHPGEDRAEIGRAEQQKVKARKNVERRKCDGLAGPVAQQVLNAEVEWITEARVVVPGHAKAGHAEGHNEGGEFAESAGRCE